jgi:two-component system cell cycle sensor histidine kinase/response regulator CckA
MSGKELSERLNFFQEGFKSIFISGYTADIITEHGVIDEGVHFLQKPFSMKTLPEKVREVLDN